MRKIILYIATSLNGKIAKTDGSVDWLNEIPNPDNVDYEYEKFSASVDTTIQGYTTYKQVMDWDIDFPYTNTMNYVFTTKKELEDTADVAFVSDNHINFVKKLKQEDGGDIWLIGGGQMNTLFLNAGLIDEIQVFIMPIILSGGIELFEAIPKETPLKLLNTTKYKTGAVALKYVL